jgi:hypothetical protein
MTKDKWSHDELNELQHEWENGIGWLEISKSFGRTPDSCRMAYRQHFGETGKSGKMKDPTYIAENAPRIGLIDLETLPIEAFCWGLWDVNVGLEQIKSPTGLLSWAGKMLNAPEVQSDILTPKEAKVRDEKRVALSLYDFLKNCDIVVGQNLIDFDARVARTFFLKYDLPPLKYIMVDTLKICRRELRLDSNKLQFINHYFGLREKIENEGFPLWKACMDGDADALKRMRQYNIGDIAALEDLFYKVRPYIRNIQVANYVEFDGIMCPVCGSKGVVEEGNYYTPAGRWTAYRCKACKCLSRGKTNLLVKGRGKSLLINS